MVVSQASNSPHMRPLWVVVIALGSGTLVVSLASLVMTFALPSIQQAFDADAVEIQWVSNAYTLSFAAALIPAARAGDRFGRRRIFLVGLLAFALASLVAAFSGSLWLLLTFRAMQGLGAAAVIPLGLTLAVDHLPPARRSTGLGALSAINGLGTALGPLVGGLIIRWSTWQAVFWVNVVTATLSAVFVAVVIQGAPGTLRKFDKVGALLSALLVLVLGWGVAEAGADSGRSLLLAAIATACIAAVWVLVRRRLRVAPLIPARLLHDMSLLLPLGVAFCFTAGMFGAVFALSLFIQIARGQSALEAALWAAPWTLTPMLVAPLSGVLVSKLGIRPVLVTGLLLQTVAMFWFAFGAEVMTGPLAAFDPALMAGIGLGVTFPSLSTALFSGRDSDERAAASGLNSTMRQLGTAIGVAVAALVLNSHGALTAANLSAAIRPSLIVCASFTGLATILALLAPRTRE
ncbi:MAG: MFS transporter [Microbacterium sp.]